MPHVDQTAVQIIRRYQPFMNGAQFGNHPLYQMNEAVRRDKHRAIQIIVISAYRMSADSTHETISGNFAVHHAEHLDRPQNMLPGTQLLRVIGKRVDRDKPNGFQVRWFAAHMVPCLDNGYSVEMLLKNTDDLVVELLRELTPLLA
jgi:hypothetical protein